MAPLMRGFFLFCCCLPLQEPVRPWAGLAEHTADAFVFVTAVHIMGQNAIAAAAAGKMRRVNIGIWHKHKAQLAVRPFDLMPGGGGGQGIVKAGADVGI